MRNFTKIVRRTLPLILAVAAIGMVGAGSVKPVGMFEDQPQPEAPKGTVSGIVTLPDGNPAAAVTVKITAPRTGSGGEGKFESTDPFTPDPLPMVPSKAADRTVASVRTNADGRYTVDVPPGSYKVVAQKLGAKGEAKVEVVAGKVVEQNVKMEKVESSGGGGGGKGGASGGK